MEKVISQQPESHKAIRNKNRKKVPMRYLPAPVGADIKRGEDDMLHEKKN